MDFFVGFQFYSVGIYDRLSLASMSTSRWCLLCAVILELGVMWGTKGVAFNLIFFQLAADDLIDKSQMS